MKIIQRVAHQRKKKKSIVPDGKEESMVSSAGSNNSSMSENYSTLLQAFHETHEEANRLAGVNNRLKGLNNWLKNRVSSLEEELEIVKTDFEHLNMIYQSSGYENESTNQPSVKTVRCWKLK